MRSCAARYCRARHRGWRRQAPNHHHVASTGGVRRARSSGLRRPRSPWTDLTMLGALLETKATVVPPIHKAYLEERRTATRRTASIAGTAHPLPLFVENHLVLRLCHPGGSVETLVDHSAPCAWRPCRRHVNAAGSGRISSMPGRCGTRSSRRDGARAGSRWTVREAVASAARLNGPHNVGTSATIT